MTLNPWYVTGLSDGEACFYIAAQKQYGRKEGGYRHTGRIRYIPGFTMGLRADDREVVMGMRAFFGVGKCFYRMRDQYETANRKPEWTYRVRGRNHCTVLVRHFDRYPLQAKKRRDYEIWRELVLLPPGTPIEYRAQLKVRLSQARAFDHAFEAPVLQDAQAILDSEPSISPLLRTGE